MYIYIYISSFQSNNCNDIDYKKRKKNKSINLYSTHTKRSDTKYTTCGTIIIYDKNKNG